MGRHGWRWPAAIGMRRSADPVAAVPGDGVALVRERVDALTARITEVERAVRR
jgi:hypothetical protein